MKSSSLQYTFLQTPVFPAQAGNQNTYKARKDLDSSLRWNDGVGLNAEE